MIRIRRAYISDVDWLYDQCKAFADFYGSKINLSANVDYAYTFLKNLIANHVVMIGEKDDQAVGFIAGMISPHHFNPDITQLTELLWWVDQGHRNSGVGAKLFEQFILFGKENCDWITFTLEEKSPISDRALLANGFKLTERAYLMECN